MAAPCKVGQRPKDTGCTAAAEKAMGNIDPQRITSALSAVGITASSIQESPHGWKVKVGKDQVQATYQALKQAFGGAISAEKPDTVIVMDTKVPLALRNKNMNTKTKQLDGAAVEPEVEETEITETEESPDEPLGAQVLRRIHRDKVLLMKDYDEMLELLEQPEVKAHVQEELEHIEERMTKCEQLFGSIDEYKDLPMIEGAWEDKAEEEEEESAPEEVDEADSEEEELPTPDEVAEGMQTKRLTASQWKALQKKGMDDEEMEKALKMYRRAKGFPEMEKEADEVEVGKALKFYQMVKSGFPEMAAEDSEVEVSKKGMEDEPTVPGNEEFQEKPGEPDADDTLTTSNFKALEPHEKKAIGEASAHLKDVAMGGDWSEEHRMKSYAFHKSLSGIAEGLSNKSFPEMDAEDTTVEVTEPGEKAMDKPTVPGEEEYQKKPGTQGSDSILKKSADPAKIPGYEEYQKKPGKRGTEADLSKGLDKPTVPGNEEYQKKPGKPGSEEDFKALDIPDPMAEKPEHPHYKAISGAAQHCKALSQTTMPDMEMRAKAMACHKDLDPIATQDESANVTEEMTPGIEPGEMGQKNGNGEIKALQKSFLQENRKLFDLSKTLTKLTETLIG